MKILVDADSVPCQIRAIILKAARKRRLTILFVADRHLKDVDLAYQEDTAELRKEAREKNGEMNSRSLRAIRSKIRWETVVTGENSADDRLVESAEAGDLAITHDIPLAARLADKGCTVLDDRGGTYDKDTIARRLSERNLMTELRSYGIQSEKTKSYGEREVRLFSQAFVTQLDRMQQ
ncbi:MAG: DUF188 domain-containing protein [Spirochaetia bacterium]|nr:DUF188 domain-containing protein [Spirochaetia bacterium]